MSESCLGGPDIHVSYRVRGVPVPLLAGKMAIVAVAKYSTDELDLYAVSTWLSDEDELGVMVSANLIGSSA